MDVSRVVTERSKPIRQIRDLAPLIERISKARVVMLGECSHGTHEFYEWRRMISEWLIVKHGFDFVAVEGDWPDGQVIQDYISRPELERGESARSRLETLHRWPTWMWANTEIVRLAEWMRSHNQRAESGKSVSFYGMDVYSLFDSVHQVTEHLEKVNPFLARQVKVRYGCFERFNRDELAYARSTLSYPEGCAEEATRVLQELLQARLSNAPAEHEAIFNARQNARIVQNAERYYRAMMRGDEQSWNIRDQHMLETLELLLERHGPESRCIVWAHNTHVGDHRATDMARTGMVSLGGIARDCFGEDQVALVGFGTYQGKVIASHAWDGPTEELTVPAARPGSYDAVFHQAAVERGEERLYLLFEPKDRESELSTVLGQRAIGVVYDPEHERWGNYVPTALARRYDAFIYFDRTTALEPLILSFDTHEVPDTWPMGQ